MSLLSINDMLNLFTKVDAVTLALQELKAAHPVDAPLKDQVKALAPKAIALFEHLFKLQPSPSPSIKSAGPYKILAVFGKFVKHLTEHSEAIIGYIRSDAKRLVHDAFTMLYLSAAGGAGLVSKDKIAILNLGFLAPYAKLMEDLKKLMKPSGTPDIEGVLVKPFGNDYIHSKDFSHSLIATVINMCADVIVHFFDSLAGSASLFK